MRDLRLQLVEHGAEALAFADLPHHHRHVELLRHHRIAPLHRPRIDAAHVHRADEACGRHAEAEVEERAFRSGGGTRLDRRPLLGQPRGVVVRRIETMVAGGADGGERPFHVGHGRVALEPHQAIGFRLVERLQVEHRVGYRAPLQPRVLGRGQDAIDQRHDVGVGRGAG